MRTLWLPLLVLGLVAGWAGQCRAQQAVQAIIDKAIQARGGEARIKNIKAGQIKSKGTLHVAGKDVSFTQRVFYQWPGQFKAILETDDGGRKVSVTTVAVGDKGWRSVGGQTKELQGKALAEMKEERYVARLTRLTTLKDGTLQLSALGEVKVDGRPAVGIKVAAKGHRDVRIYFDKNTAFLIKTKRQALDPGAGAEYTEEKVFRDYRNVGGLLSATKVVVYRDGAKLMDIEITEVKFLDKLDDSVFAKP